MTQVYFLITIDTEEDNAWNLEFKEHTELSVENIQYLPQFQKFCDKFGIRPTYLIDYPIAVDKKAKRILKSLAQSGQCEIGTHVHPWCNPPYEEQKSHHNSYLNNLPPELQFKKLQTLTHVIAENFGEPPVSYRAGRYGFDHTTVPALEELNYHVDSSVVPFRQNKHPDEPNFALYSSRPYYLNRLDVCKPGNSSLLEVPITVDFTRALPQWFKQMLPVLPNIGIRRFLRVFWGIELGWLRPSYTSLKSMKRLADVIISSGIPVLNMMFHSSELMPGGSPYNKTEEDVNHFLNKIEALILYLKQKYLIEFKTLGEMSTLIS